MIHRSTNLGSIGEELQRLLDAFHQSISVLRRIPIEGEITPDLQQVFKRLRSSNYPAHYGLFCGRNRRRASASSSEVFQSASLP